MTDAIKLDLAATPEKLRPLAEEVLPPLIEALQALCRLEETCFVQSTRLCKKGRVIEFQDGIQEEITDHQVLKEKHKARFMALLDPCCTPGMLAQRRDCSHAESYPSDFRCLQTGCTIRLTARSAGKAAVELIPDSGSIPYDMASPEDRYITESAVGKPPHYFSYCTKYRFTMKRTETGWQIDAVHRAALCEDRWRRAYYF